MIEKRHDRTYPKMSVIATTLRNAKTATAQRLGRACVIVPMAAFYEALVRERILRSTIAWAEGILSPPA